MDFYVCDLCGTAMAPHEHYIVRIDVTADPSMPELSAAEIAATHFDSEMAKLLKQMQNMTAEELADQVHRRFEFKICRKCQPKFLGNPLGKPRGRDPGDN
jgi:hypothetical protein